MNLQHERLLALCATLNLPFIAQGYAVASQEATEKEAAYSDFLEGLLRTEVKPPANAAPEQKKPRCCRVFFLSQRRPAGCPTGATAKSLLVIADRTDLVANLGHESHLDYRIGLTRTRPHVGNLGN